MNFRSKLFLSLAEYRLLKMVLVLIAVLLIADACTHEPVLSEVNPGPDDPGPITPGCTSDGKVCFESNVLPIFKSSCAQSGCHDLQTHEEGYILDSYTNIMRKGVEAGDANESKLYKVLFESGEDRMPPDGTLSQAQKDSIALWINQGALNTTDCNCYCDPAKFTFGAVIQPIISNSCVGCHNPGNLGGSIDLSTFADIKVQAENGKLVGSVSHADTYKPMPQGGKLSSCEIDQIKSWVNAGAPNN